jgi:hypothetical protein
VKALIEEDTNPSNDREISRVREREVSNTNRVSFRGIEARSRYDAVRATFIVKKQRLPQSPDTPAELSHRIPSNCFAHIFALE